MYYNIINTHHAVGSELSKNIGKKASISEIIFFGHRQPNTNDTIAIGFTIIFSNGTVPEIYYNNALSLNTMNRLRETIIFMNKLYNAEYQLFFNKYIFFYEDFQSNPAELYKVVTNKTKYPFYKYLEFFDLIYPNWESLEINIPWK